MKATKAQVSNSAIVNFQNVQTGHTEATFKMDTKEKRQSLKVFIEGQLKAGNAVFLIQEKDSVQLSGFDPESQEWIIRPVGPKAKIKQLVKGKKNRIKASPSDTIQLIPQSVGG